jgi:O-antigen/teichoic acid export membrane protein
MASVVPAGGTAEYATGELRRDASQGAVNAARLASALFITWALALATQLVVRRGLGPSASGRVDFAEGVATLALIPLSLGLDTYVRKEVSVRPSHAGEFTAGVLVLRAGAALALVALLAEMVALTGKGGADVALVTVFGLAQFFVYTAATYAAILQAVGTVKTLSAVNIVSKLLWAAVIVVGLVAGAGPVIVPAALIASELFKSLVLGRQAGRQVRLPFRCRPQVVIAVGLASLPYLATELNIALGAYLDPVFLSYLANDREVGWYTASARLAGPALLLAPLIQWVLLPVASRAAERSAEELALVMRRAFRAILPLSIPLSVALVILSEPLVRLLLGKPYLPSIAILRILAPMFILTYAAMLASTFLIRNDRAWLVARITLAGICLNSLLNAVLIPIAFRDGSAGAAGQATAVAFVVAEAGVTVTLLWKAGRELFDRRSVHAIGLAVGLGIGVLLLNWALAPLGQFRLIVDAGCYATLLFFTSPVSLGDIRGLLKAGAPA